MATAGRIDVSPLPQFDPVSDPSSLGQRWTQWKRRFETYILAVNVTDDAQKRALLLYQAGAETQELYDTLLVEKVKQTIMQRLSQSSMPIFYPKRMWISKYFNFARRNST